MQFPGVMERTGNSCHGAGLRAYVSTQRIGEGREVGRVLNGAPDGESQPAAGTENATHVPQCLDTIGEELHALLTLDHIEGSVHER